MEAWQRATECDTEETQGCKAEKFSGDIRLAIDGVRFVFGKDGKHKPGEYEQAIIHHAGCWNATGGSKVDPTCLVSAKNRKKRTPPQKWRRENEKLFKKNPLLGCWYVRNPIRFYLQPFEGRTNKRSSFAYYKDPLFFTIDDKGEIKISEWGRYLKRPLFYGDENRKYAKCLRNYLRLEGYANKSDLWHKLTPASQLKVEYRRWFHQQIEEAAADGDRGPSGFEAAPHRFIEGFSPDRDIALLEEVKDREGKVVLDGWGKPRQQYILSSPYESGQERVERLKRETEREGEAQALWGFLEKEIELAEQQRRVINSIREQRQGTKRDGQIGKELGISRQAVQQYREAVYTKCRRYLLNDPTLFDRIFGFILRGQNRKVTPERLEKKRREIIKFLEKKKAEVTLEEPQPSIYPCFSLYETIFYDKRTCFNQLETKEILRWDSPDWARLILAENPLYIEGCKPSQLSCTLLADHLKSSPLLRIPREAPIRCPNCGMKLEPLCLTIQVHSRQLKINKTWQCPKCLMKFKKLGMPKIDEVHKFKAGGDYVGNPNFSDWWSC